MSNSEGSQFIEDPHTAIINAMEIWRTGLALQAAVKSGRLSRDSFPDRIILDLGDGTGMPIPTSFDPAQLDDAGGNIENATLATAVIAADSALDAHFAALSPGTGRPLDKGDRRSITDLHGIDAVRALLYLIRNAFAHDPFNPMWEIRSVNRRGVLEIEALGIRIDTTQLNGQPLHSGIGRGGWGFLQLLQIAEKETRPSGWDPEILKDRYPKG